MGRRAMRRRHGCDPSPRRRPARASLVTPVGALVISLVASGCGLLGASGDMSKTAAGPDAAIVQQATSGPRATRTSTLVPHVLTRATGGIAVRLGRSGAVTFRGTNRSGAAVEDWNRREVYTRPEAPRVTDQRACATWESQSVRTVQQGLAVRVRTAGGRTRAVTVTKNTFAHYSWYFNVLTWDTRRRGDPWRKVAQFDMSDVVSHQRKLRTLPWRVCVRARGRVVALKVWLPRREARPRWDDPTHVRRTRVPRRFVYPGAPGWYVGHVPAGETTTYTDLHP